MIILPIETVGHAHDAIVIVIDSSNLERMRQGDPAEVDTRKTGKTLVNPVVQICFEDPSPTLERLVQGGDLKKILEYLQRGWKFRPEAGDNDLGPQRIADGN